MTTRILRRLPLPTALELVDRVVLERSLVLDAATPRQVWRAWWRWEYACDLKILLRIHAGELRLTCPCDECETQRLLAESFILPVGV